MATREGLSAYFTIAATAIGLISDGYIRQDVGQRTRPIFTPVVFKDLYPHNYTYVVSTRVALFATTALIVLGAILATAAHDSTPAGLFWFLTVARGITGVGVGGEYPVGRSHYSAFYVINLAFAFGGPLAVMIFLIVLSAAGRDHLQTVWRVCFGIGIILPLGVFIVGMRMMSTILYRRGAIKRRVPYLLALGAILEIPHRDMRCRIFLAVTFPNGVSTIIANVIKSSDVKKTAEWQLLLGVVALLAPGFPTLLYHSCLRTATGYLTFGLIIGCAYDEITKIVPLFVVFYGLMQSSGNLGPGDMMGSYPTAIRGTAYGISAVLAYFIPDMTGINLAEEDAKFMDYLAANGWNGWNGRVGEDGDEAELVVEGSLDEKN
ncbi:hypothetical protein D9757_002831 [Collybiopsis confluens]|uniref:Uncharacterized protein n=1 Tax=Collybiopsis confluens TaxID=2823264 RepID=A0A8H5HVG5_9AGAR|nr:hypothetical protein D9757_002831 [Collybiopsis confluens]